jgi:hypothetical protein
VTLVMKVMEKNRSESAKRSRNNTPVSTPSSGNIAHNILNKSGTKVNYDVKEQV